MRAGGIWRAALGCALSLCVAPHARATTAAEVGGCEGTIPSTIIDANPGNYRSLLDPGLAPGTLLRLAAGIYPDGLPFNGHHGAENDCIIVEGPDVWPPTARFTVRTCCNTVSIQDSSYLVIRNLEIDGTGDTVSADGVKAETGGNLAHHITLENLFIHHHDLSQQTVCISTKIPAWNWVIRNNVLDTCGTGAYLGNSDGEQELVNSLIEHNLFVNSVGYNMQVKHQNGRNTGIGMPASGRTIIRHNVFSKGTNSSGGADARPNLLLGHWPLTGAGSDDDYLVYGNLFYGNPTGNEPLFQGEGNVIFYDNLLVNTAGAAVRLQAHEDQPRRVRVFQNTVVADDVGISVTNADDTNYEQWIIGNAVFANSPILGGTTEMENLVGTEAAAATYLTAPAGTPGGGLDLFPLANGLLQGSVTTTGLEGYEDWDRDFNGTVRSLDYRGGYAGQGTNPGWALALERKPDTGLFADGFESGDTSAWSAAVP
jgi:hypothetical protein